MSLRIRLILAAALAAASAGLALCAPPGAAQRPSFVTPARLGGAALFDRDRFGTDVALPVPRGSHDAAMAVVDGRACPAD